MNTNRYISGDYVKFEGKLARIEEVNSLYYLLREYYENYGPEANDEDCYLYKEAKDVEPIPLTPEILEKNKWCLWKHHEREFYEDVSWDFYYNPALSCVGLRFYPEEEAFFPYLYREGISEKPIKYVHQFQHLLFGLEINSEIKVIETVL